MVKVSHYSFGGASSMPARLMPTAFSGGVKGHLVLTVAMSLLYAPYPY